MWLLYVWDDWAIPWAGIAAVLAGTGSLLSGWAALKLARQAGADEARDPPGERSAPSRSSRVPGVGGVEPGATGGGEDGDR